MNFLNLDDGQLVAFAKSRADFERAMGVEMINLIKEIERRKIFLARGYSSLFDFVTKELGYEDGAALRRIQAARLLREVPEVEDKISANILSLTNISLAQSFFRREEKATGLKVTNEQKRVVLKELESKSTRAAEDILIAISSDKRIVKREFVRRVADQNTQINLTINDELKLKLDKLRSHLSHKNPHFTYAELFSELADIALQKFEKKKVNSKKTEIKKFSDQSKIKLKQKIKSPSVPKVKSRYISAKTRREVWIRDCGCCTYIDPQSMHQCRSDFQVQVHHSHAFALGGSNEISNLRLLCRAHNGFYALRDFGIQKMEQFMKF